MKHVDGLLILGLCVLAACDPPPPPPAPSATALPTRGAALLAIVGDGSMQAIPGLSTPTPPVDFHGQQVCATSTAQQIEVRNTDSSAARQISFAGVTPPFVLTRIEDSTHQQLTPPFSLAAGASAYFFVALHPEEPGAFNGNLTLITDDPVQGLFTVALSGQGIGPRLEISSTQEILVPGGTATVTLHNGGTAALSSLSARVSSPFSAQPGASSLAANETTSLTVTFPASAAGTFAADILTVSSTDPCRPTQKIKVVGALTSGPQLVLSHLPLSFSAVSGSTSAPLPVKVKNHGGARLQVSALTLEGVSTPAAGTQFAVTPAFSFGLEPGEEHTLNVKFAPTMPGTHTAQLKLTSNSAGAPHTADLSGSAVERSPSIAFDHQLVQFATRGADETDAVSIPVEITNTGNVRLNLAASISEPGSPSPFTLSASSLDLAPQAQGVIIVTFRSQNVASGEYLRQLVLQDGAFERAIPIQANVIPTLFAINPATLAFDSHELGAPAQVRTVLLTNWSDSPVTISGSIPAGAPFSVNLPENGLSIPANGAAAVPLTVTFRPTTAGTFTSSLLLLNTPRVTPPAITLTGRGRVFVATQPDQLVFPGQLPLASSSPMTVTLTPEDSHVTLENVDLNGSEDFTLRTVLPIAPDATGKFRLEFLFTPKSAGFKQVRPVFKLKTESDQAISSNPNFWLRGTAAGPLADFSPVPLAFGLRQISRTHELPLEVQNRSTSLDDLKLTRVEIINGQPSAAFSIDALPATEDVIHPGASRTSPLKVKFTPGNAQDYTGELLITYRGTDPSLTAVRKIPLTGKGTTLIAAANPQRLVLRAAPGDQQGDPHEVFIKNNSLVAIDLETVQVEPSPTSFRYDIEGWPADKRIGPNGEKKITVKFFPSASTVTEERTLSVKFAGEPTPLQISLSGKAGYSLARYGELHVQFNDVAKDTLATYRNSIKNEGATKLTVYQPIPKQVYENRVTGFSKPYRLSSTQAREELEWPVDIQEGDSVYFDVEFQPRRETPASVTEVFLLKSNSNGDPNSEAELEVNGTVASPQLTWVGNSAFTFTPLLNTASQPLPLVLTNGGRAQLKIFSISVSSEAVPYFCISSDTAPECVSTLSDISLGRAASKTVYVRTKVIQDTSLHTGKLVIHSNSGSSATFPNPAEFNLRATAIGELTIIPANVPFKPCNLLAQCRPEEITLTNSGSEAVEVASIQFDPPGDFGHGPLPDAPIAPGASKAISLSFSPRSGPAAGLRSATGTITLKSGKTFTFNVTGTATTARLQVSLADPLPDEIGTDVSSVNFGGVRAGTHSKPRTLVLKNVSPVSPADPAGDLTITKVLVEGRDKALFTLAEPFVQKKLAVGDSVSVTLYFEPNKLAAFSANLVVTSDASQGSQYQVLLSGEGLSSVLEISPYELDFHKTVAGSLTPPKKQVVIKNTSIAPITITSVGIIEDPARASPTAQADHFSVPPFTPKELASGESWSVEVTFLAKAGIASASLLKITSDAPKAPDAGADLPEGLVKLRGEGLSSVFKSLPSSVDFGTIRETEQSAQLVEFTNDSSETIHLLPPILEGTRAADFRVTFLEKVGDTPTMEVPSGGRITMKIEFDPQAVTVSDVSLRLATTAQERAATIALKGKAVTRFLEVDPLSVEFMATPTGEQGETKPITLTNQSDSKARISVLKKPSQAFILDESPLSEELPAGGSVTLSVTFSPTVKGLAQEELTLRLQRVEPMGRDIQTDVAIQLKGEGQEIIPEGGGCSSGASGTGALWAGGLLVALATRRRARGASR
jgi:hypothetical protein